MESKVDLEMELFQKCESKERKVLKFLVDVKEILRDREAVDINTVCNIIKGRESCTAPLSQGCVTTGKLIRNLLFVRTDLKLTIHNTVTVLLEFIYDCIDKPRTVDSCDAVNQPAHDRMIIHFTKTIAEFLVEYERCAPKEARACISDFLVELVSIVGNLNKQNYQETVPKFQVIMRTVMSFKGSFTAEKIVRGALKKELLGVCNILKKSVGDGSLDYFYLENLLMLLWILKQFLQYNLYLSVLNKNEKWVDQYADIKPILIGVAPLVPFHVEFAVRQCLNML